MTRGMGHPQRSCARPGAHDESACCRSKPRREVSVRPINLQRVGRSAKRRFLARLPRCLRTHDQAPTIDFIDRRRKAASVALPFLATGCRGKFRLTNFRHYEVAGG